MDKQESESNLNASLVLAIFLEVYPIEADILFGLHRSFGIYILTKLVMLTLILLPLGVYIYRKKRGEERTTIWSWKLMVIALIVSINLLMNYVVMVRWFGRVCHRSSCGDSYRPLLPPSGAYAATMLLADRSPSTAALTMPPA